MMNYIDIKCNVRVSIPAASMHKLADSASKACCRYFYQTVSCYLELAHTQHDTAEMLSRQQYGN